MLLCCASYKIIRFNMRFHSAAHESDVRAKKQLLWCCAVIHMLCLGAVLCYVMRSRFQTEEL